MQLTQSQEDYLETIYVLKSQQENVRAIDVAAALGFSKPSVCLLYTSPSPRDTERSRMPSSA